MDLMLKDKYFLVTGASSGFGKAVAEALIKEGARVLINARSEEKLIEIKNTAPNQIEYIAADITIPLEQDKVLNKIGTQKLHGAFINAGGPPAKSAMETKLKDWDEAFKNLVRWKIRMTKKIVQRLISTEGGRLVFLESISVKQPVPNLALSNSMRMAIVGYVKTLSSEVAHHNISMNILAPGYHETAAMDRIIAKKAEVMNVSLEEAKNEIEKETLIGKMGNANDLAKLALFLLSENASYINGQTISVDGGHIKHVFG